MGTAMEPPEVEELLFRRRRWEGELERLRATASVVRTRQRLRKIQPSRLLEVVTADLSSISIFFLQILFSEAKVEITSKQWSLWAVIC